jgi:predicted RNase H-like HicB family nuclease
VLGWYISEAMKGARYKALEDGTHFGRIPGLAGVWANEATAGDCRDALQEVLEEWLVLARMIGKKKAGQEARPT